MEQDQFYFLFVDGLDDLLLNPVYFKDILYDLLSNCRKPEYKMYYKIPDLKQQIQRGLRSKLNSQLANYIMTDYFVDQYNPFNFSFTLNCINDKLLELGLTEVFLPT